MGIMLNDKCTGAFNFENSYKGAVSTLYGAHTQREKERER